MARRKSTGPGEGWKAAWLGENGFREWIRTWLHGRESGQASTRSCAMESRPASRRP
jgi:hypothetical protein